ncbi:hypothetical protein XPR_1404 [Xanthomonas arboricola pv. pruni MAFF 301420]|uniref:Uncharacterized protein n=2 Tax=Xanthomonas arboricola pv. pruni TaxID=69929 RepID=W4SFP3_9XANT|nr:hypothetical protein XPU_0697 [Xanthomonas arboricola pv. pruni str. MAFF 311562]GAE54769.1 hypothetical protein XPR_1404 [Xanthomonas arboricola pv. pruni MAFF 301420]
MRRYWMPRLVPMQATWALQATWTMQGMQGLWNQRMHLLAMKNVALQSQLRPWVWLPGHYEL